MLQRLVTAFPLWVVLASALALYEPRFFTWFSGGLITVGLAIIMLGMGLTLEADDFRRVARQPRLVAIGVVLQYCVMPLAGWALASLTALPTPLAVGLILVACCPGGTASNVMTYLSRGDVPLSVTMTAVSTVLATLMTPLLATLLASSRVDVPAAGLLASTLQVVILPVAAGLALRRFAPRVTHTLLPVAPLLAVLMITLIVGSIIASGRADLLAAGARLLIAVALLHACGFLLGYAASLALGVPVIAARTIAIEVGMQNSGLAVVLARVHFANPLTALPGALSAIVHCVLGSALAAYWRRRG